MIRSSLPTQAPKRQRAGSLSSSDPSVFSENRTVPASAIRVREELRRIMLAEWENPTGAPQEVLPDNVVPLKRKL